MTVYNIYIFDRNCTCLYYHEWVRRKETGISQEEEFKLVYGMIFSLKSLISRISPSSAKDELFSYSTDKYKMHLFESLTGLKIILNTDHRVADCRETLNHIYSKIYVEYVIKNPEYKLGERIDTQLFIKQLDTYIQSRPYFGK